MRNLIIARLLKMFNDTSNLKRYCVSKIVHVELKTIESLNKVKNFSGILISKYKKTHAGTLGIASNLKL